MPEDRLSLLIDGRPLGGAGAYRGLGTYTRELVAGLAGVDDTDIAVLAPSNATVPAGVEHLVLDGRGPDRWASAEHQLRLARAFRHRRRAGTGEPVFHAPGHDVPRPVPGPWVQTVADVIPLVRPEAAYAPERRRWRRWSRRLRTADAVITFSRHSAAGLVEHLGVDEARIRVIPLAAASHFRPAPVAGDADADRADADRADAGPGEGAYILSVGEYAPHKGYSELAQLAAALVSGGLPHRLVVAGRVAPQWSADRERDLGSAGAAARERIELAGWVPDLARLYRRAAAVVCTSRLEGFGLPLVEAMACGTPLVAFANSAVTEVVGDGGQLVADGDVAAMAAAVTVVVGDADTAGRARLAARNRSSCFSWDATIAAHVDVYRSVRRSRT